MQEKSLNSTKNKGSSATVERVGRETAFPIYIKKR
jgi:hypothetical protein